MLEFLSGTILMLGSFAFGIVYGYLVLTMAVSKTENGERVSAWMRRKLDHFDAKRERHIARRRRKNQSKDA